jgi:hypothetical protein
MRATHILLAAVLILTPATAMAGEEELQRATELFRQGNDAFDRAQYRVALQHYRTALELAKRPNLYLAIAQCQRLLGETSPAVANYRRYLDEWQRHNPGVAAPHRAEVEGWIRELTAQVERARQKEEEAARAREAEEAERRLQLEAQKAAQSSQPNAEPSAPARHHGSRFYRRWWFWTLIGTAVVGGVVAAVAATTGGNSRVPSGPTYDPGTFGSK